jgi:hypothetical protein
MTTQITVPSFQWSARSYADFRQEIRRRGRVNVPELTDESDADPYMQIESAVALIGHLSSARIDFVARHLFLPTSLRRGAVDALLRWIGEPLSPASPAVADLLCKLTRRFAGPTVVVPALSRFSTEPGEDTPAVTYESPATAVSITFADSTIGRIGWDESAGVWVTWAVGAQPWGNPTTVGDCAYFAHDDVLFDGLDLDLSTAMSGTTLKWEYHGHSEEAPDAVVWASPNLTLTLTSLLGATISEGAEVTVYCPATGVSETADSVWASGLNKVVIGALGQISPSTALADYVVSVEWTELPGLSGAQAAMGSITEDEVRWTLPQTTTHNWTSVDLGAAGEGYFVRARVVAVAGPVRPVLGAAGVLAGDAEHYLLFEVTQGETVEDDLGQSDGSANQAFALGRSGFIGDTLSSVVVETDVWSYTENPLVFYASDPTERICLLDPLTDGTFQLLFGDGAGYGAIPPVTFSVVATYRVGADSDGNAGAGAIKRNTSGVGYVSTVTNPRPAVGWAVAEGSTREDLERVKRTKPAAMRAGNRIVTPGDAAALVVDEFTSFLSGGSRPVYRAWGVEEAFGAQTIGLYVVGAGGEWIIGSVLSEINDWANGTSTNDPDRLLLANYELTAVQHIRRPVQGIITVTVARSSAGVAGQVQAILEDLLRALKTADDGSWMWAAGGIGGNGRVSPTFIAGWVFANLTVQQVLDVVVDTLDGVTPAATVILADNELPWVDFALIPWTINVVVV